MVYNDPYLADHLAFTRLLYDVTTYMDKCLLAGGVSLPLDSCFMGTCFAVNHDCVLNSLRL